MRSTKDALISWPIGSSTSARCPATSFSPPSTPGRATRSVERRLRVLAQTAPSVGHCPYKYAKMAMTLQSFQRYLEAGVNLAIATDTYPRNRVQLRWASILAKVADANYQAALPRDVFNAATPRGCKSCAPGPRRTGARRERPTPAHKLVNLGIRLATHQGARRRPPAATWTPHRGRPRSSYRRTHDGVSEDEVYAKRRQATEHYGSPSDCAGRTPVERIVRRPPDPSRAMSRRGHAHPEFEPDEETFMTLRPVARPCRSLLAAVLVALTRRPGGGGPGTRSRGRARKPRPDVARSAQARISPRT